MDQLSLTARQILTEPALMSAPVGSPVSLTQMQRSHLERFGVRPHSLSLFHEAITELAEFGFLRSGDRRRGDRTYFIEADWNKTALRVFEEALVAKPTDQVFLSITQEEREHNVATSTAAAPAPRKAVHAAVTGIGSARY